jgi:polyhydroxyalkanoate synthesis regulator phasin
MVINFIKKGFKLGLKAAHVTEKEAKGFAKEIVAAGIITVKEGEDFAREMLASGRAHKKNLSKRLSKNIGPRMRRYGSAIKSSIRKAKSKVMRR